MLQCEALKRV